MQKQYIIKRKKFRPRVLTLVLTFSIFWTKMKNGLKQTLNSYSITYFVFNKKNYNKNNNSVNIIKILTPQTLNAHWNKKN